MVVPGALPAWASVAVAGLSKHEQILFVLDGVLLQISQIRTVPSQNPRVLAQDPRVLIQDPRVLAHRRLQFLDVRRHFVKDIHALEYLLENVSRLILCGHVASIADTQICSKRRSVSPAP